MARNAPLHEPQAISSSARLSDRQPERVGERSTGRHDERRLERPSAGRLTDKGRFAIDLDRIPPGYVMEWKRHSVMDKEDKRNQVVVRQYHWQPVPHKMQPQILAHTCKNDDEHILVDGLGLYMRPKYLNDEAMQESKGETDYQLSQQLESLRMNSRGQVGDKHTRITKQTVAVGQPVE